LPKNLRIYFLVSYLTAEQGKEYTCHVSYYPC